MAGNKKLGFRRSIRNQRTNADIAHSIYIDISFKAGKTGRWKGDISNPIKGQVKKMLLANGFSCMTDKESGDLVVINA
jgi:hypothetical protein